MIAAAPVVCASAVTKGEIRVVVTGLRNDEGRVGCSLFNDAEGFPRNRGERVPRNVDADSRWLGRMRV